MYELLPALPAIDLAALEGVLGGDSSTTRIDTPVGSVSSSTSDYQACVNKAGELAAQQHPSTRTLNPMTWFSPDGNASARREQERANIIEMCGKPRQP